MNKYLLDVYNPFKVEFLYGKGSTLFDKKGNDYIDFTSGIGVSCLGHGNKKLVETISKQAKKFLHLSNIYPINTQEECAKKVAAFEVINAASDEQAMIAAKALSNSLLVKTALFGEDPNFGRIASTIGASRIDCDDEKLVISYNDVVVFNKGEICFDAATEARAFEVLKKDKYKIICDIGLGNGKFTAYGCDLGYKYVEINADYRS